MGVKIKKISLKRSLEKIFREIFSCPPKFGAKSPPVPIGLHVNKFLVYAFIIMQISASDLIFQLGSVAVAYLSESESSFIEVESTTTDKDAVKVYKKL